MKRDKLKPLVFSISDLAFVDEPTPQPNFQNPHDHAVYKATEVEAVIAHQNFKRCLAMALWCESKVYHIRRTPLCDMSEHEYWQYENDF